MDLKESLSDIYTTIIWRVYLKLIRPSSVDLGGSVSSERYHRKCSEKYNAEVAEKSEVYSSDRAEKKKKWEITLKIVQVCVQKTLNIRLNVYSHAKERKSCWRISSRYWFDHICVSLKVFFRMGCWNRCKTVRVRACLACGFNPPRKHRAME